MKLSSPSSAPLSLNSLPRGYFSKCTTNKSSGAKGTPLRSKQNIKSKVFNENKQTRTSRSIEQVSEFDTNCSQIEVPRRKQISKQSSKNNEILIVNYEDEKQKNHQSSNRINTMLKGLKNNNEPNNLEEELQKVLQLIKQEREKAKYLIQQTRQNKQKQGINTIDACFGTQSNVLQQQLTQNIDKEIQTTQTKCPNKEFHEDKQNLEKIRLLMNDMKMGDILGQAPLEDKPIGVNLSDIKEKQVIKLNKIIIRKLVQKIMDLQTL